MHDVPQKVVRFRVGDVVHPRPMQVLMELFRHMSLEGEVVAATSDGQTAYLVVRVVGLPEAVIVPTEKAAPFFEIEGVPLTATAGR